MVCDPVMLLVPSNRLTRRVKEALPVHPSALVTCTVTMVVVTKLSPATAVSKVFVLTPRV